MDLFLGWLGEHSLVLLLAAGTIFTFCWLLVCREKLSLKWPAALILAVLHTIAGVFCVKVFAVAEYGFDLSRVGNMSLFGGVFFMPVFYFLGAKLFKRKVADVFDVFAICMIFTVMCARIGCIVSGCCRGLPISGTGLYWPTREAEIVFYIVFLILTVRKSKAPAAGGRIYPLYMATYGLFRFICEWFRASDSIYPFHLAHFWALLSLCIGVSIYAEMKSKTMKLKKKGK